MVLEFAHALPERKPPTHSKLYLEEHRHKNFIMSNMNGPRAFPRKIKKYADLTGQERRLADDLIHKLSRYGLLGIRANAKSRKMFWDRVFRGGWDSSKLIPRIPSKPPKRDISQVALPIGTLTHDAVSKSPGKKLSPKRRAGAEAFVLPQIRSESVLGLDFQYVDGDGRTIPTELIRPFDDRSLTEIRIQAVEHFEANESERVNEWNLSVLVMWARRRLRARLMRRAPELEDEGELEQLVSAVKKLDEMRAIVAQLVPGNVEGWKGLDKSDDDVVVIDSDEDEFNEDLDLEDGDDDP